VIKITENLLSYADKRAQKASYHFITARQLIRGRKVFELGLKIKRKIWVFDLHWNVCLVQ